jgi:hypothetical protein
MRLPRGPQAAPPQSIIFPDPPLYTYKTANAAKAVDACRSIEGWSTVRDPPHMWGLRDASAPLSAIGPVNNGVPPPNCSCLILPSFTGAMVSKEWMN